MAKNRQKTPKSESLIRGLFQKKEANRQKPGKKAKK